MVNHFSPFSIFFKFLFDPPFGMFYLQKLINHQYFGEKTTYPVKIQISRKRIYKNGNVTKIVKYEKIINESERVKNLIKSETKFII